MKITRAGDSALFVRTGDTISSELSLKNRSMIKRLNSQAIPGIIEFVGSYTGFMVYYDPLVADYALIESSIENASHADGDSIIEGKDEGIIVPVAYGGEYGPDISYVADLNNISAGEVARKHSAALYTVHMLGFTPGFPYMGGMDSSISSPRKSEPALHIEAGSVGIAGDQTGIYPVESPGGWQIIGRTPLVLFDPHRQPEFLFSAGMKVRFKPVDNYEFWSACELISNGEYEYERF